MLPIVGKVVEEEKELTEEEENAAYWAALEAEQKEQEEEEDFDPTTLPVKLAIVGRPNVGKSTLTNRMLGEERVVVYDMPGTTRDSIYIPMERDDKEYILIDTAGVRKRGKVKETVEKFSVIKTLQAIEDCNVALLVIDAREGFKSRSLFIRLYS
ncbi:GTPase [Proteus mirabilis]